MSLKAPQLDDRSFYDLLAEAKRIVRERCPEWTDLSAGDPGTTLLELYAFLTEVMLYRINRLPEKAYIEFLRMMGVKLAPPSAARVALQLRRAESASARIDVPRGTRVTVERSVEGEEPPVFVTAVAASMAPGQEQIEVVAHHCRLIEGEVLGVSNGLPGQSFELINAPVVAPTGDDLDLVVAVESTAQLDERLPSISLGDATFRVWREVEHFSHFNDDDGVYTADRASGIVTFAAAARGVDGTSGNGIAKTATAMAAIPPAGMRICAWYRCGGGPAGNVAAHRLRVMKDPIAGLRVDNPQAAVGGCEAESLDNALLRGPQELHSLQRAVSARDYEAVALREGSVGRAHAVARAERWRFAEAGTVQVLLVPDLLRSAQSFFNKEQLEAAQTDDSLTRVRQAIDERRPLGTQCVVDWYRYKAVKVQARLVLHTEENPGVVRDRVVTRLNRLINPLGGHSLRRKLHASDIYHTVLDEPGVMYVDQVRFEVDQSPGIDVESLAADPFHPHLWYAAAGERIFRSMDDGGGWELLEHFPSESIDTLVCSRNRAGLVAAISHSSSETSQVSRVRISRDCGRHWETAHELGFSVNDAVWLQRADTTLLLLATDEGLFQLPPDSGPVPVLVDEHDQGLGFFAVEVLDAPRLGTQVAVAARKNQGVYLCPDEHLSGFHNIGLKDRDVRTLFCQRIGPRTFLWAGMAAVGGNEGEGCLSWELRRDPLQGDSWVAMNAGWQGGSCRAFASHGEYLYAATFHAGVLAMDSSSKKPVWKKPDLDCGLPIRDADRHLHRIDALGASPTNESSESRPVVLCGGPQGVYRSHRGQSFEHVSSTSFNEHVTIGEGYLFCSDEHNIEVIQDAEI